MGLDLKINKIIDVVKVSNGYSLKVDRDRLCNINKLNNGLYSIKCRSKDYANLLPTNYKISHYFKDTRNYDIYTAKLTKKEAEKWIESILNVGISKRLDNR